MDLLKDINQHTVDGRFLIAALSMLTVKTFPNKTPYEVLDEIKKLSDIIFDKPLCVENPFTRFADALKWDPEMFRGYKDNIAMAFKDVVAQKWLYPIEIHTPDWPNQKWETFSIFTVENIHEIANQAAENFLNQLIK